MYKESLILPNFLAEKVLLHLKNGLFVGQECVREHCFGLIQQYSLIIIARRIVPQKQLLHASIASHRSSLAGSRVCIFLSQLDVVLTIGALMIERGDMLKALVQIGDITSVTAIGIRARLLCRLHQPTVRHMLAVGCYPVGTSLDVIDLTDGNLIEVYHITADMRQHRFLAKQESAARHAMLKRDAFNRQRTVFVNHLLTGGFYGMEVNLIVEIVAEQFHLLLQDVFHRGRCIDGQPCSPPKQPKGAEHAYQAEAVIAVQMGDEDSTDFGEADA